MYCLVEMTSVRKRVTIAEKDVDEDIKVAEKDDSGRYADEKRASVDDLNLWRHLIPESVLGMYPIVNLSQKLLMLFHVLLCTKK